MSSAKNLRKIKKRLIHLGFSISDISRMNPSKMKSILDNSALSSNREMFIEQTKKELVVDKSKSKNQRRKEKAKLNTDASTQHKIETLDNAKVTISDDFDRSQKAWRATLKSWADNVFQPNVNALVENGKTKMKVLSGSNGAKLLQKLAGNRWLRRSVIGIAGLYAFSKVASGMSSANDDKAIPRHYNKSYDIIKHNMTDFGSPVNLWKTAMKTITPYHSSIRKGFRTSVNAEIQNNLSLQLASRAIGHMKY